MKLSEQLLQDFKKYLINKEIIKKSNQRKSVALTND